jgi:hypothetical protein
VCGHDYTGSDGKAVHLDPGDVVVNMDKAVLADEAKEGRVIDEKNDWQAAVEAFMTHPVERHSVGGDE